MSFTITIGINQSPKNSLDKTVEHEIDFEGVLKDATSIIDPVIMVEANLTSVRWANYMKIPAFGRYYFINNIRSIRAGLVAFECHVDVLTSYADEIRGNTAIIKRNENAHNILLNDGFFKVRQNPHIVMYEFPTGFTTQELVLAMAGSS